MLGHGRRACKAWVLVGTLVGRAAYYERSE